MGALQRMFQGSLGKVQTSSITFRNHILDILDQQESLQFAFTWCPGDLDIEGNEEADLAKSGSHITHKKPDYKSLSYVGSLHKCEIGEEWRHRWTNQNSTLRSKFHVANCIPPSTKPTDRFVRLDRRTFSHTLQCHTGYAHILFECGNHARHRHILGTGRARNIEVLLGLERRVRRRVRFLMASRAYERKNPQAT